MNNQEEQMKDISKFRKTCVVVLAAAGLAFGSLAYAESGSGKNEGKRTLSPESTHGTEKSLGTSKSGTSGTGTQQSRQTQGSAQGGSSNEKFTNTTGDDGGGKGSGAMLQGGVDTNKQGTTGGADSMGGMRSGTGTGQGSGQGARSGSGSGGSGSSSGK
jgi:hypothetical protein